jgi:hypothetical protein
LSLRLSLAYVIVLNHCTLMVDDRFDVRYRPNPATESLPSFHWLLSSFGGSPQPLNAAMHSS